MEPKRKLAWLLIIVTGILYTDFWNWSVIEPLVFGWISIGFFYQIMYTLALIPIALWTYSVLWGNEDDDLDEKVGN